MASRQYQRIFFTVTLALTVAIVTIITSQWRESHGVGKITRSTTSSCRWSNYKLDCRLIDIDALGGLSRVAKRSARVLDLSFCKINEPKTLMQGLRRMPYLTEISLDFNFIKSIPKMLFWGNRRLNKISIRGNKMSVLPEQAFWRNPFLTSLDLSRNHIKKLPPKLFFRNKKLKHLELWNNKIKEVPSSLFSKNALLDYVSLGWNQVRNLPPFLFERNRLLKTLKLHSNILWCVSSHQFEKNQELREINFAHNNLKSLPSTIFRNNKKLTDLKIWSNQMDCLPRRLLEHNERLSYVNVLGQHDQSDQFVLNLAKALKGDEIEKFKTALQKSGQEWCDDERSYGSCKWNSEKRSFTCEGVPIPAVDKDPLPCDTQHLNLISNEINDQHMLKYLFQSTPDLVSLTLTENKLKEFPGNIFYNLRSLEKIDLSSNNMETIPLNTFRRTRKLKEINLSKNELSEFHHNVFAFAVHLRKLNIAYNLYEELADVYFSKNRRLQELDLSHNMISFLPDNLFKANTELVKVDASFNRLEYVSADVLKSTILVEEINLRENMLAELEENLFRNLMHLKTLDLSNNRIEFLPDGIFKENENLRQVSLNGNQIFKLNPRTFANNPDLAVVSLDENLLGDIPDEIFTNNKNLEALGLQYNCISYLSETLLKNNPVLSEVSLRNNPTLPREIRRIFEGEEEIQELREQLQTLNAKIKENPIETERELHQEQPEEEESVSQTGRSRKEDSRYPHIVVDESVGFIQGERLNDDVSHEIQTGEELLPVGGEEIKQTLPRFAETVEEQSEIERSRRSADLPNREINHVGGTRVFSLDDFVKIKATVKEEDLDAVCMKVWKRSGFM